MKEINAYQSDDGKFIGTKEQVLEYEKKQHLERLYHTFCYDSDEYGELYIIDGEFENFLDFVENNEYFKDFVKLVYGFQEGEDKDDE